VNISGGTVSATAGRAVHNNSSGAINVSGTAQITSVNSSGASGTVYLENGALAMTGGDISNTVANGNAVIAYSSGAANISGGTVRATTGYAVNNRGSGTSDLTGGLAFAYGTGPADVVYGPYSTASGNAVITAWDQAAGNTTYIASTNKDLVASPAAATSVWAANGGASGINYANGANQGFMTLADVTVTAAPLAYDYVVTAGIGGTFTATRGGVTVVGAEDKPIQTVINAIKTDANGNDCKIQFGSGADNRLNIGGAFIEFNGGTGKTDWGQITITGNLESLNSNTTQGTIVLLNDVSIESKADIWNSGPAGRAINNYADGTVTVSEKTISASGSNGGVAIYNNSAGSVVILGGTLLTSTGSAIYNNGPGDVNISGGAVTATATGNAVYNNSTGEVTISGGTVSATAGYAVYNASNGPITVTGDGTVEATTGQAIYNASTGKITVSGTALVTSQASTQASTDRGTIHLAEPAADNAGLRLEITGGTVENTGWSPTYSGGNAIYNVSSGEVRISGGIVQTTVGGGSAVYNNAGGALNISGSALVQTTATYVYPYTTWTIVNESNGTVTVSGGTVLSTSCNAIYNNNNGTVIVTGGMVRAEGDYAIAHNSKNTVTVSGGTVSSAGWAGAAINSNSENEGKVIITGNANITSSGGSAVRISKQTITGEVLVINGGTVENTDARGAIELYTIGITNISGGTISAVSGEAINSVLDGKLIVSNNAKITSSSGATISGNLNVEVTGGIVENTAAGAAIYTNNVTISGGTVSSESGNAIGTISGGVTNISNGTVTTKSGIAVRNDHSALTVSGGTISATTTGDAIYNTGGTGAVSISAGTVSAATGKAFNNNGRGTVIISGGTVKATAAGGYAVYNTQDGEITVSGGSTVSAATVADYAIYNGAFYDPGAVVLDGNPAITGIIWSNEGRLGVNTAFSPAASIYKLALNNYALGTVAVKDGELFAANFALDNQPTLTLANSGGDLVVAAVVPSGAYEYIITSSGTTFTATRGGVTVGTAGQAIQTVIDAIKTDAAKNPCTIQFGSGTDTLDIGSARITFDGGSSGTDWGPITLAGGVTAEAYDGTNPAVIILANGVSVRSEAYIANTVTNSSYSNVASPVIRLQSAAAVTIFGGTVKKYDGIYNSAINTWDDATPNSITLSGGTVVGYIGCYAAGTVTMTGGTVVGYISGSGNIVVSGGTVSGTNYALVTGGKLTVEGSARVTSSVANTSTETIRINNAGSVEIIGGTVENTAAGGAAVNSYSENGTIVLGGNPTIIGIIRHYKAGKVSVKPGFAPDPATKVYTLALNPYNLNDIAVVDGANHLANFALYNQTTYSLAKSGGNLVVALASVAPSGPYEYVITGSSTTTFTATRNGTTVGAADQPIQTVIDAIKGDAIGNDCSIQFGNGTNVLDIGSEGIEFNGGGSTSWGLITLKGKLTSNYTVSTRGTIFLSNGVSINSEADMENTAGYFSRLIYNSSSGTVAISGGTISSAGVAVFNTYNGKINISGGTLSAVDDVAIVNNEAGGEVNISGTAQVTGAYTNTIHMWNGTLNITGGRVENTAANGNALYNASIGAINISGGTVQATATGNAVYNASNGPIVLDANPVITGIIKYEAGTLSVNNATFAPVPAAKIYTLALNNYFPNAVAVVGGKDHLANFTLNNTSYSLTVSGSNLVAAATPYEYVITGSSTTTFTATRGGATVGTADQPIQDVIDAIKTDAAKNPCTIQFGSDDTDTLVVETHITFDGGGSKTDWGPITLAGGVTSELYNTTWARAVIILENGVSVNSEAYIASTGSYSYPNSPSSAIQLSTDVTLTILDGTISGGTGGGSTIGMGNGALSVTVSGGTVLGTINNGNNNGNKNNGTVTVTGGTVLGTISGGGGNVVVSGGAVSGTNFAIGISNGGNLTVKGTAKLTSSVASAIYGTIQQGNGCSLEINGGTVENTAAGGLAVYKSYNGVTTLDGNPTITGIIQSTAGNLSVNPLTFAPDPAKVYTLELNAYNLNDIAVVDGADYKANFALNNTSYSLVKSGGDLAVALASVVPSGPYEYIITGSGTTFTATRGGVTVGAADQPIQTVIDAIKGDANGNACSIQFGDNTTELNIGAEYIEFGVGWGLITLTGKITSFNSTANRGVIFLSGASIESKAYIANSVVNANARAIYNNSTGSVTISDGTVTSGVGSVGSTAIYNNSSGTVTISGGTVSATTGYVVRNNADGTVIVSGGTVSATTGNAIFNNASGGTVKISDGTVSTETSSTGAINNENNGTVIISGGTVSAITGRAIYNYLSGSVTISGGLIETMGATAIYNNYTGKIAVSGGARVTAAVADNSRGTIHMNMGPIEGLVITGGTIENTAVSGNAIYNNSGSPIILGGSPTITGIIEFSASAGKASVNGATAFTPAGKVYTLELGSYTLGAVAVTGGAAYLANFALNNTSYSLAVSGSDLVVAVAVLSGPYEYIITGSGTTFTATRGGVTVGTAGQPIQDVIDYIKADATGNACTIQFGDNTTVLDIDAEDIEFDGSGATGWGLITLRGKLTSSSAAAGGVIRLTNGASIDSKAELTSSNIEVIYSNSTGAVTISGGTVSAMATNAIYNGSTGKITVSGTARVTAGTIYGSAIYLSNGGATALEITGGRVENTAGGNAVSNNSSGAIAISGGTVSAVSGNAISNNGVGAVTVSGGEVSSISGMAVVNASTGTVTISGGTVQATGSDAYAVHNVSTGKVIVSGNGAVSVTSGLVGRAISNESSGEVEITGGTVSSTEGFAVYNGASGKVTISGGTLTATADKGYAVHNESAGEVIISGGTISATTGNNCRAVSNRSNGTVTITGGAISAATGHAVYNESTGSIVLGSNPAISGIIKYNEGRLSVNTTFAPVAARVYTLELDIYDVGTVAVVGGGPFKANFALYDYPTRTLAVGGGDLVLAKVDYDMSGVTFADMTVTYDGSPQSIYITGTLPAGVTVSYTGNGQTAVGTYTVTAEFSVADPANYNVPASMTAALTINNKRNYDMSGVTFANSAVTYNGSPRSIYISGALPAGVTVSYTGNGQTAVGTYTVTAVFAVADPVNYNVPASMTATLTINSKQNYNMSGVTFTGATVAYNGNPQSIYISGTLPSGVTVSYVGNGQTAVGTYTVTAVFSVADPANYNVPASMTAALVITGAAATYTVTVNSAGNGAASASASTAAAGAVITLTATANAGYAFKEWRVASGGVTISGDAFTMPAAAVRITAYFEIVKVTIDKPYVKNTGLVYTGKELSAGIEANAAYTVSGDRKTNVGDYTATVVLRDKAKYEWSDGTTDDLYLDWAIVKADVDFSKLTLNATYSPTLKLSNLTLPAGYAWSDPTVALVAGDGQSFEASYTDRSGNYNSATGYVTVNVAKAAGRFVPHAAINAVYSPALRLSDLALSAGYDWSNPSAALNAGNNQRFAATFSNGDPNYYPGSGTITVNVAKAEGTFVPHAALKTVYSPKLKLSNMTLSAGYSWSVPATLLSAGDDQVFAAVFTDPSGNYTPASGNITLSVDKAPGVFVPQEVNVPYSPTLKLSDLALVAGYVWSNPSTALDAGNNQSFAAVFTDPFGNYYPVSGNITVNVQIFTGLEFVHPVSKRKLGTDQVSDTVFSGEVYTVKVRAVDQNQETVKSSFRVLIAVLTGGAAVPKAIMTDAKTGIGVCDLSIAADVSGGRITVRASAVFTDDGTVYSDTVELLVHKRISVLSPDRNITGPGGESVTVVVPVKAPGGVTAGPNPVGTPPVQFFRTGSRAESGTLYVYDALGNLVNTVKIEDAGGAAYAQEKRLVGSWDLTNTKGRRVSEGTYAVRGTITTADGKKEKAALTVNVR